VLALTLEGSPRERNPARYDHDEMGLRYDPGHILVVGCTGSVRRLVVEEAIRQFGKQKHILAYGLPPIRALLDVQALQVNHR
jgi:hypothetical protein